MIAAAVPGLARSVVPVVDISVADR